MDLNSFIEGLKTLKPYYDNGDGYHIGADHDHFYAYATDRPLTPEDVQKMRDLGWFQTGQEDEDDDSAAYDPEDGWSAFV